MDAATKRKSRAVENDLCLFAHRKETVSRCVDEDDAEQRLRCACGSACEYSPHVVEE